ncbi:MAG: RagB/SusD family nutrient uptake outer membrane protein, partial [Bacteroidales bacterium]|nr:RagB/SusD family nutrient uptake outer membrane protein [Bacteroidales bacterium]
VLILVLGITIFTVGCEPSFLDISPKGTLTEDNLTSAENIEGLVIAAYSTICQLGAYQTLDGWMLGDVRGGDNYKGGSGLTDQSAYYDMEIFVPVTPNVGNNSTFWVNAYAAISRSNAAIRQINKATVEEYPLKNARLGEMLFLRGLVHFHLKERYKWIPFITEELSPSDIRQEPNRYPDAQNDLYIWQRILDDFTTASQYLPPTQTDKGRPTAYSAKAYAVITMLWMAYKQDETHQVTDIDEATLQEALALCNDILTSSDRDLTDDFGYNFMPEHENNVESLFEIQYSINDGTEKGLLNYGQSLNTPRWQPHYRCCDFHKVTYNLINAFRTGADGLPLLDTFNEAELKDNYFDYFADNTFDPRLSHTAGIPGHPWKYDPYLLYDSLGSRNPDIYGYVHSLKEQVHPLSSAQWENRQNSMNKRLMRLAQVMLWKAEILIKLNREDEALPVINEIRQRAQNSTGMLVRADNSPILDYNISLYEDGVNCNWTNEYAWKAYLFESRIEMASEGFRFFDLVRWGIAADVINGYFAKERERHSWLTGAFFTQGKHEYLPIPQDQINLSEGLYVQNINY